jgi:hypothetical protein
VLEDGRFFVEETVEAEDAGLEEDKDPLFVHAVEELVD